MCSDRTKRNHSKYKGSRFRLSEELSMVKHWNHLPRAAVDASSLNCSRLVWMSHWATGLIKGGLAYDRGVETRWSLRSHTTKVILWSLSYLLVVFGQTMCYYCLTNLVFLQEHKISILVSDLIPWWLKESLIFSLIYFLPQAVFLKLGGRKCQTYLFAWFVIMRGNCDSYRYHFPIEFFLHSHDNYENESVTWHVSLNGLII